MDQSYPRRLKQWYSLTYKEKVRGDWMAILKHRGQDLRTEQKSQGQEDFNRWEFCYVMGDHGLFYEDFENRKVRGFTLEKQVVCGPFGNLFKLPDLPQKCFLKVMYLFTYFQLCWVPVAAWTFSSYGKWGLLSSCGARASHLGSHSCWGHRL